MEVRNPSGLFDLVQLYDFHAQRGEQQRQSPDGCGDGQGHNSLKGLTGKGEAQNDKKLR